MIIQLLLKLDDRFDAIRLGNSGLFGIDLSKVRTIFFSRFKVKKLVLSVKLDAACYVSKIG